MLRNIPRMFVLDLPRTPCVDCRKDDRPSRFPMYLNLLVLEPWRPWIATRVCYRIIRTTLLHSTLATRRKVSLPLLDPHYRPDRVAGCRSSLRRRRGRGLSVPVLPRPYAEGNLTPTSEDGAVRLALRGVGVMVECRQE